MSATLELCSCRSILEVEGSLRAPVTSELTRRVQARLVGGERRILLDLGRLSDIDAAGVGELVRVYKTTRAAGGVLRITHAGGRVGRVLQVTGLLQLLTAATNGS